MGFGESMLNQIGFGGEERDDGATYTSFGERMSQALCGVCFGVVLFIGSLVLLGWNEKRAVYTAETIDYARDKYIQLDGCTPLTQYNDELVAITGCEPSPESTYSVSDADYLSGIVGSGGVKNTLSRSTFPVFSWSRKVQEYVRKETSTTSKNKNSNGGTVTTYSYSNSWVYSSETYSKPGNPSPKSIPSSFRDTSGSAPAVCIAGNYSATGCSAGTTDSFVLNAANSFQQGMIKDCGESEPLTVDSAVQVDVATVGGSDATKCGNYLQTRIGSCSSAYAADSNEYGDFRWWWSLKVFKDSTKVSVLAKQVVVNGVTTFEEWQNPDRSDCSYCTIGTLESGTLTGEDILDKLEDANTALTWILRFVGWLLCWFALQLVVGPIALAPEIIPFIGDFIGGVVGKILCTITCIVATSVSLLVIAIAWLAFRPMIGIPLLILFCCGCVGAGFLLRAMKNQRKKTAAAKADHDGPTFQPGQQEMAGGYPPQAHTPTGGDYGVAPGGPPGYAPPQQAGYPAPPGDGGYPQGGGYPMQGGGGYPQQQYSDHGGTAAL